jgi:hypothetical protein
MPTAGTLCKRYSCATVSREFGLDPRVVRSRAGFLENLKKIVEIDDLHHRF